MPLRCVMDREHTRPEPSMDVSGDMLASMELGIKSITWDKSITSDKSITWDKSEVNRDTNCQLLASWIIGGCHGSLKSMPASLHPYWDGVPILEDITVKTIQPSQTSTGDVAFSTAGYNMHGLEAEMSFYWPGQWSPWCLCLSMFVWITWVLLESVMECLWTDTLVGLGCTGGMQPRLWSLSWQGCVHNGWMIQSCCQIGGGLHKDIRHTPYSDLCGQPTHQHKGEVGSEDSKVDVERKCQNKWQVGFLQYWNILKRYKNIKFTSNANTHGLLVFLHGKESEQNTK